MWGVMLILSKTVKKKKRKKSGCVITNCITVVLLPWIHSIKMQTFDSVCCDIVENCNIVTVFSTYIWILFALIIKLRWSFHLCPCALKAINDALHKPKRFGCFLVLPSPWCLWWCCCCCCLCDPAITPSRPPLQGAMHAFSARLCQRPRREAQV